MVKGIPGCISPELMSTMMRMGHGDYLLLADADFPAETYGRCVIRADGVSMQALLEAVLKFFPLDCGPESPVTVMAPWQSAPEAPVLQVMKPVFQNSSSDFLDYAYLERFDFYERTKNAFAVVITSEPDGNFLLRKGVVN